MKSFLKILLGSILLWGLSSSAYAYSVGFDQDGTSTNPTDNTVLYTEFDTVATNSTYTFSPTATEIGGGAIVDQDPGTVGTQHVADIFTYQNVETGAFTENFTIKVAQGQQAAFPFSNTTFEDIYLTLDLYGTYVDDDNVYFDSGSARMFDGIGDVTIAELNLISALPTSIAGSLLGADGLGLEIDFSFEFLSANDAYWNEDVENLASLNWLLAMSSGSIDQDGIYLDEFGNIDTTDDEYIIEWIYAGSTINFEVVPEPTTMLLFGIGLLGLAGVSRRKLS